MQATPVADHDALSIILTVHGRLAALDITVRRSHAAVTLATLDGDVHHAVRSMLLAARCHLSHDHT